MENWLRHIGKGAFVKNFDCFRSYAKGTTTREQSLHVLMTENGYAENGASIRLGYAKQIFDEELECAALKMVSQAAPNRLGKDGRYVVTKAINLMETHCLNALRNHNLA